MDVQKTIKIALTAALGVSLALVAGCANLRTAPVLGGERCYRCSRTLDNRFAAAEMTDVNGYVAYKFRTVRCMLAYLSESRVAAEQTLVADFRSGKLIPVERAHFVRVPIERISENPTYGIGPYDYVAFRSSATAERYAADADAWVMNWAGVRALEAFESITARR